MKTGQSIHGFRVQKSESLTEIDGVLYTLTHEKHGTPLLFLDRDDANKSFYIAFRTLPEDDTGVFHIIEHSVLSGSRRFPVKEPFVEMLKSSLKTFLNALTYSDRTVYPVSSRSDKDFCNLVTVYMDAVLHPLMLENEFIFMQEGHRLELAERDAELSRNGVVYSEMQGAMSSPEELMDEELTKALYRGTVYAKNSGGDPDAITKLTFEEFKRAHEKYYHPKNARIFLDGRVDLDSILPIIDTYLSEFEKTDTDIALGEDVTPEPTTTRVPFELGSDEQKADKTRISVAFRTAEFDELEKILKLSVLADAIAGSNEAPLKKAMLASGLVEDMSIYTLLDGVKHCSYAIELKNVKDGCEDEALRLLDEEMRRLVRDGIGKEKLEATLSVREFRVRESDFGDTPRGLVYGLAMLDLWMYGDAPASALKSEEILKSAGDAITNGEYEELLEKTFITNTRRATVILEPSDTLADERAEREKSELQKKKALMSDEEISALIAKTEAFEAWQNEPDSEENLDTLPTLSLSDIPNEVEWTPTEASTLDSVTLLTHDIKTNGITYAEMFFDVSDLDKEELSYLSLVTSLLGRLDTASYTAERLLDIKKSKLGAFYASPTSFTKNGKVTPYLKVFASSLDKNRTDLVNILDEILNTTSFADTARIKTVLKQTLIAMRESFISSGHSAALRRANAYVTEQGVIAECIYGIEMLRCMERAEKLIEGDPYAFSERLAELLKRSVSRKRLTVAVTAEDPESAAKALATVPRNDGTAPIKRHIEPLGRLNEGFIIPSRVSYAAKAADFSRIHDKFHGSMMIIANILSYTYLWESIRVRGGAYGAGFTARASGLCYAYSYRDPSPRTSLEAFDGSWDFIDGMKTANEPLDDYIIGTFGDYDAISTPRQLGMDATGYYLAGKTLEEEKQRRGQMLGTTVDDLASIGSVFRAAFSDGACCVFGPRDQLSECADRLSTLVEL